VRREKDDGKGRSLPGVATDKELPPHERGKEPLHGLCNHGFLSGLAHPGFIL
jgi:hypothetical protein